MITLFPASATFRTKVEWIATVTPRLGVTSGPVLFYVKGGVAFTELHTRIQDLAEYNERNDTKVGWTVGGYRMDGNLQWIVGVEGNYHDFGRCCGWPDGQQALATNPPLAFSAIRASSFDPGPTGPRQLRVRQLMSYIIIVDRKPRL